MEIGDRVVLTPAGAKAHRRFNKATGMLVFGVVTEALLDFGSNYPEAGMRGEIVDKRPRAWGQPGHDYQVQWVDESFERGYRFDWHLSCHLKKDTTDDPLPWETSLADELNCTLDDF